MKPRLTTLTSCGGCASKVGPGDLSGMIAPLAGLFPAGLNDQLLVGLDGSDDAAVYRINASKAVVATLDFFAPLVDDPFLYGQIAAANALSDVYAMGAEPAFALNIAAFPESLPKEVAAEVLRGGAEKVGEAGAVLAGGHSIWDEEPKYGLCAFGFVHPKRMLSKGGLRGGDRIYLTKPIGAGTLLSAARGREDHDETLKTVTDWMTRLNRGAAELAVELRLRAATDVTGFGLLGHLCEMALRSKASIDVRAGEVPLFPGAYDAIAGGFHTGGEGRNREWARPHVSIAPDTDPCLVDLLHDPQTSGGLLIGCPRRRVAAFEEAFRARDEPFWCIGEVRKGEPGIQVTP